MNKLKENRAETGPHLRCETEDLGPKRRYLTGCKSHAIGEGDRIVAAEDSLRDFSEVATALAWPAERQPIAFLGRAFLASLPLVSRWTICSSVRAVPWRAGPTHCETE